MLKNTPLSLTPKYSALFIKDIILGTLDINTKNNAALGKGGGCMVMSAGSEPKVACT